MDNKPSQPGPNMNMNNMGMVGGAPGMEHGATPRGATGDGKHLLNTYIYDYFCKNNMFECANALLKSPDAEVQVDRNFRQSPSRRQQKHEGDGNAMNGIDDETMDGADGQRQGEDGDEPKTIKDLPPAKIPAVISGSFLLEWWCCFTDIYWARTKGNASVTANAYVNQTQQAHRFRNDQVFRMNPNQAALMSGQPMNVPAGYPQRIMAMNGAGVIHAQEGTGGPGDMAHKPGLQRTMMRKLTGGGPPHQMNSLNRTGMMQHMANREGEANEMNGGQRPQSPAPGASTASPGIKRQRLENGQYEQVGNGRGNTPQGPPQGANAGHANAASAHQLLLANGINPNSLSAQQFQAFQNQAPNSQHRSIQMYAQSMAAATGKNIAQLKGGPGSMLPGQAGQAGASMMPQTSEGGIGGSMGEFYAPPAGRQNALPATGNHALQDYQMQLMLLEQQNKKRLMAARQEHDQLATHGDANRPGSFHQSMSPNSRPAPSPGPGGKPNMTGTPKMANQVGPGSPLPDGQMGPHVQQRNSPASAPGFNGQIPEGGHAMMYGQMEKLGMMANNGAGVPNGAGMMRPPFNGPISQPEMTEQINANLRVQQAANREQPDNAMWQQHPPQQPLQQSLQQQQQGQPPQAPQAGQPQQNQPPQQAGTPQPVGRNAMPPPQAPGNPANAGRPPAPASPNQQPPTPTQSHKANPKGKAAGGNAKKQRPKKGVAAAAQANAVTPTTSEPPTPTTPQHPASFNNPAHARQNFTSTPNQPGGPPIGQTGHQPSANSTSVPTAVPNDPIQTATTSFSGMPDIVEFSEAFGGNDADLLDHFDFDSFLNTTEDNNPIGFGSDALQWNDSGEVGAGET